MTRCLDGSDGEGEALEAGHLTQPWGLREVFLNDVIIKTQTLRMNEQELMGQRYEKNILNIQRHTFRAHTKT